MADAVGAWVERWLSVPRFATYVTASGGDRAVALALYEWNVRVSGALFHDLAHLEIGLRNAYDRALSAAPGPWTDPGSPLFARPARLAPGARDANARFREQLADARVNAEKSIRGTPAHGDVVAQLPFGFWRFLSAKAHEKALWVPYLHEAFPPGTDRRTDVDEPLTRLHRVRNRIAHHEPLLRVDVRRRLDDIVRLAYLLGPELGRYVAESSTTAGCLGDRPAATP